ncbi:hypothetical protein M9458_012043, partial [Cirrhinus mrigala]
VSSLSESPEEEEMDTPEEERKDLRHTFFSFLSFFAHDGHVARKPQKKDTNSTQLELSASGKSRPRFQESFNENEEKTFSEDIFKLLDLQKVTLFSGAPKSEKEKVEGQKDTEDTGLHKTASDVVDKQVDAPKTQAQSTAPLPKPRLSIEVNPTAVSREKPATPTSPAVQKNNAPQQENTDSTNIIN